MRDPKRIDPLLEKLGREWKKHPDLRFGQLVSIIFGKSRVDPFYIEDEELLGLIEADVHPPYITQDEVNRELGLDPADMADLNSVEFEGEGNE